ncbi:superinfection immunity protein [bacterium]|nr:superinfection immunity protein [bacterium]
MADTKICRYCGNVIPRNAENCGYCGKYLLKKHDNPDLVCEECKAPVNTDDNFCQECGAIFGLPEVVINPEPYKGNMLGIPYNIGILLTSFAASIAVTVFATSGKDMTTGGYALFFSIAFIVSEIVLYIYFLPSILAIEKNNPNALMIYICNLLFGITIIGWFVTLIMGLQSNENRY